MRYLLLRLKRFCGFITGFVFFLSGLVKLMDPTGTGFIMAEYMDFLHIGFMEVTAKPLGIIFALTETTLGIGLITGVWRRAIAQLTIMLQSFFTLLTLLLVIFNPEMDCGCFGEAIHLTHWQTFIKNLILMALLLAYYIPRKHLGETRTRKYVSFGIVCTSVAAFTVYSLISIPMMDFTAYKPGAELVSGKSVNPEDMYESVFTYSKDGVTQEFTLGHLPDTTWTFVSADTRLIDNGTESGIELSLTDPESGEYVDSLASEGKVMVISIYKTKMSRKKWSKVNRFVTNAENAGFTTMIVAPSKEGIPSEFDGRIFISDRKTIMTLNRSNAGITYFCNGELIRKWSAGGMPDKSELESISASDPTEVLIEHENKGSLGFQGFLLYVFAVMLLL